ncbi:hypothetical protein J2S40_002377 [Nocardioides luteus]|uniref:hypothetical protein n=1 Tax=Nocardioides luteus TaxID=1844 RepID=UPI002862C2C4|nr:hypothetical protein [Nocardioides luteus]MDR7311319.1 hypothetical protein [Nocardioides luteus]
MTDADNFDQKHAERMTATWLYQYGGGGSLTGRQPSNLGKSNCTYPTKHALMSR